MSGQYAKAKKSGYSDNSATNHHANKIPLEVKLIIVYIRKKNQTKVVTVKVSNSTQKPTHSAFRNVDLAALKQDVKE